MKKVSLLSTAAIALVFGACNDSKYEGYKKADNGLHYKFFNHDESAKTAVVGDGIGIRYTLKKHSADSVIFDSKSASRDGSGIYNLGLSKSLCVGGIEDALMMMAQGDSASFIFSADSFFLKTNRGTELPPFIKPGEQLIFDVKMVSVKTAKELEENQKMQMAEQEAQMKEGEASEKMNMEKYLADNKITTAPTESGLIFIETKKGNGKHPKATDEVTVHYTGTLLDGTKFDSSVDRGEPAVFKLTQVIMGWTEGIQLMSKGSKAKLIVPSRIGYGPQGRGEKILPFSTLAFDVELIDFKEAPAQPEMPQQPGH